ncbi:hypothetical protein K8B33_08905 [Alcanivorax sp. JB21]|uniref:hypothetical protein n=1 Tax=Alcanivorax limicola TaxID=2874102 RepID=UPI001CC1189C|nr:hypothetical protein [Alcanivorax limicola]MBZ2189215.1 hypothetical protein [Alcanivorax limicola]
MLDNTFTGLSFPLDFLAASGDSGVYMLAGAAVAALLMLCLAASRLRQGLLSALLVSHVMIPTISICLIAILSLHAVDQVHWMSAELEDLLRQGLSQR